MMNRRVHLITLIVASIAGRIATGEDVSIQGTVTTSNGEPIPAVLVRIYRGDSQARRLGKGTTNKEGAYDIKIKDTDAVLCIRYDKEPAGFHPGIIETLSGKLRQDINKVLLATGEKMDDRATITQALEYEGIFWLTVFDEEEDIKRLRDRYQKAVMTLKTRDKRIDQRLQELLKLYSDG